MNPIYFSQIIGNEEIKRQLNCMISKKAIGHALLFAGPDGIGKSLFAWAFAAQIMAEYDREKDHSRKIQAGQHPDVHVYRPEGKLGLHSIQALRQLSEEVHLPPYEASWKVFIIHDADRMLSYSANALLKTFEEPPSRTVMILLSRSQAALLPTILSRCCTLHFHALPDNLIHNFLKQHTTLDDSMYDKIVRQAQGSLGRALRLAKRGDTHRDDLLNFLARSPLLNYRALQEGIQVLNEQVEMAKKHAEEAAKEDFFKIYADHQLSAQQQHALEKELEGFTALAMTQKAQDLFEHILSWYRDMHLLLLGGSSTHLANPDFHAQLQQAVQRGDIKPLNQVYQAVEEAYLALQRSTPLPLCLENLFLKLGLVS
jgi:DNA polymerase-3 subunit delta'